MKLLYTTSLLLALAAPAFASGVGGDSITNNDGIAVNGTVQGSVLNNNSGPGAGSTIAPSATASNTNVNANTTRSSSDSHSSASQGQHQSATSGVSGSGNSSVSIKNAKQAPAVIPPGLANGYDCNGSASFGGSVAGFGIAGGSTTVSEVCENVFLSRELERKRDFDGSWGVLCEIEKVRKHSSHCPVADHDDVVQRNGFPSVSSDSPKH